MDSLSYFGELIKYLSANHFQRGSVGSRMVDRIDFGGVKWGVDIGAKFKWGGYSAYSEGTYRADGPYSDIQFGRD